jgi:hypothetical protein
MKTSESIAQLAPALVAASADLKSVHKDRENTHYKNKYATLDAIVEQVRPVLALHGLVVIQGADRPITTDAGTLLAFSVVTRLLHVSGEWIETSAILPLAKHDPQGAGSAMTYGRRYGLSSILSLATDDDDDGESAVAPRKAAPERPSAPPRAERPASAPAPAPSAPAAENVNPSCPKCDGAMWDNRADNVKRVAEGKKARPAFGCKDKQNCDGIIWSSSGVDEPRGGAAPASARAAKRSAEPPSDRSFEDFPAALEEEPDDLPF